MLGEERSFTPDKPDSRLSIWLSCLVWLGGLGTVIASVYIVGSTYSPLPYWDEWALFDHFTSGQGASLAWLWALHNEHRLLVPKLFFLLDLHLFRGAQAFLLASIFAVLLLQVCLLSFSLRTLADMRGSAWRLGTGLIAFCILCPTQLENLTSGFQLCFVIPAAMATLAILSLLRLHRNSAGGEAGHRWLLLLSIAAATIATWSLANGMVLWPLLLLSALWLGMRTSTVAALLVGGVVNIGLYLFHYHRQAPESALPSIASMGRVLEYIAVYFGSTWMRHPHGWLAAGIGAIGLCAAAVIVARTLRQGRDGSLFRLQLALLLLFCVVTAGLTALGRLHFGLEQAWASRYQTIALLFWCCLGLALLFGINSKNNSRGLSAYSIVLLLLMLAFGTQLRLKIIDAQWRAQRLRVASYALMTGVDDLDVLAQVYPDPQIPLRDEAYMKQNRLSIFAGESYSRLGTPLENSYRLRPASECWGQVWSTQAYPADSSEGLRITGYAWDRKLNKPVREMVAAVDGRVSGFGTTETIPMVLNRLGRDADPARFGWVAFVRDTKPGSQIELYAVLGDGGVCRFADASR